MCGFAEPFYLEKAAAAGRGQAAGSRLRRRDGHWPSVLRTAVQKKRADERCSSLRLAEASVSAVGAAALGSPSPPCLKGGAPVLTLGRGDTSFPLRLPLEDSDLHSDICACEKNLGQIRIGHGADSPKSCVVLRPYRRDVREAVPYDGDGGCVWDRDTAPQPLRHRLAGDRRDTSPCTEEMPAGG